MKSRWLVVPLCALSFVAAGTQLLLLMHSNQIHPEWVRRFYVLAIILATLTVALLTARNAIARCLLLQEGSGALQNAHGESFTGRTRPSGAEPCAASNDQ
jgi:hypothetical protein